MADILRHAAVALALTGCGSAATQALVIDTAPARREAPTDAERYALSGQSTVVEVQINGMVSYTLSFPDVSGDLWLALQAPEQSLATLVVDTRTATTNNEELGRIAKSKDFLDVETYPEARFEVRQLTKSAEPNHFDLVGVLELHGTQKALTVPFELRWDACAAVAATAFAIDRRQFGVESDTMLDGMASDDVDIRVRIEMPRKNAPPSCAGPLPP